MIHYLCFSTRCWTNISLPIRPMKHTKTLEITPVSVLNHLIAAYTVTSQNARFCHWNVVGPLFEDNHEFFGELYDELSETVDLFAERIRALNAFPISSFKDILEETSLTEYCLPMNAAHMQKNLLTDLEHISKEMENFAWSIENDLVTQDIIVSEKQSIDKKSWMLRSMLWV